MYEKDNMMHDSHCDADEANFLLKHLSASPEMIPERSTKLTIYLVSQVMVVRFS